MKIWTYLSTLLAGIIAGLLIFLKLKDPDQVINDNQRIGKLKQRREGNNSTVEKGDSLQPTAREIRQENRAIRKNARIARRRERQG